MSSASAIQAGLKACKLFHGLDDKAVQHIAEKAVIQKQSAGTHLILPGDKLSAMYVVLKGWVKVYRINENGEEAITCLFGPKDSLLGDLLFYSHPSPVGAQTETEAELIQISVEAMRQLMSAYPTLGVNVLQAMADLTHDLMYLVEQVTVQPAVERIAGFLLKVMLDAGDKPLKEFELPFEKAEIARHLGITPETFSRSLKELAKRGITVKGRKVYLSDGKSLCANCDPVLAHRCENSSVPGYCRMFNT